jgi:peptidoglycan/xylan/chitin deacetylase (PgdA/CDA1 family)
MMIKKLAVGLMNSAGIVNVKKKLGNSNCIVLCYHKISPYKEEIDQNIVSASPEQFENQMKYLSEEFNVLNYYQFKYFYKRGFPKNSILITFDDSYREHFLYAYPVLKKYRLPALLFLPTDFISSEKLFWWDELAMVLEQTNSKTLATKETGELVIATLQQKNEAFSEVVHHLKTFSQEKRAHFIGSLKKQLNVKTMAGDRMHLSWKEISEMTVNGIMVGPHTASHPLLKSEEMDTVVSEISKSKSVLEKMTGKKIDVFCYPNGRLEDISEEIKAVLRLCGIRFAFTTIPGSVSKNTDSLLIPRLCVSREMSFGAFKAEATGLLSLLRNG